MKKIIIVLVIPILFVILFLAFIESIGPSVNKNVSVAQVNGVGIQKQAYEKKVQESETFFKWQKQDTAGLTTLQKDAVDALVDESLINQYATQHKISVSESEVNERYLQTVAGYNRRSNIAGTEDTDFLAKIKEMYGIEKSDYLLTLKEDIVKERVQVDVGIPLAQWILEQKKSAKIKIF